MFSSIRADLAHYSRFCCGGRPLWMVWLYVPFAHPASVGVMWYRLGSGVWRMQVPLVREFLQLVYLLGMPLARWYSGVQIQPQTVIGPGLAILHFGGVVITRECAIGENCLLYHHVNLVTMKNRQGPKIGNNFYAGVGTTIIGDVTIEDNVTCGAGSIVTRSIPRDAVVAGAPARILRFRLARENNAENKTAPWQPAKWMRRPEAIAPPADGGDRPRGDVCSERGMTSMGVEYRMAATPSHLAEQRDGNDET